jgi:hypothetical protein
MFTSRTKHFRHGTSQIRHRKPSVTNLWRFWDRHRKRITFVAPLQISHFSHRTTPFQWWTHFRHVTACRLWLRTFVMEVTATWCRACWQLTWLSAMLDADVVSFHVGRWRGDVHLDNDVVLSGWSTWCYLLGPRGVIWVVHVVWYGWSMWLYFVGPRGFIWLVHVVWSDWSTCH